MIPEHRRQKREGLEDDCRKHAKFEVFRAKGFGYAKRKKKMAEVLEGAWAHEASVAAAKKMAAADPDLTTAEFEGVLVNFKVGRSESCV